MTTSLRSAWQTGPKFVKRDWSMKMLNDWLKQRGVYDNRQRMGQSTIWLDGDKNIVAQVSDNGPIRTI